MFQVRLAIVRNATAASLHLVLAACQVHEGLERGFIALLLIKLTLQTHTLSHFISLYVLKAF